jgi:hypothetical protein
MLKRCLCCSKLTQGFKSIGPSRLNLGFANCCLEAKAIPKPLPKKNIHFRSHEAPGHAKALGQCQGLSLITSSSLQRFELPHVKAATLVVTFNVEELQIFTQTRLRSMEYLGRPSCIQQASFTRLHLQRTIVIALHLCMPPSSSICKVVQGHICVTLPAGHPCLLKPAAWKEHTANSWMQWNPAPDTCARAPSKSWT